MKKWDGIAGDLQYVDGGDLYKDENDGSIFYKDSSGALRVWCGAEHLTSHLMHLYQITRRSKHEEKNNIHIVNRIKKTPSAVFGSSAVK